MDARLVMTDLLALRLRPAEETKRDGYPTWVSESSVIDMCINELASTSALGLHDAS